MLCQTPRRLEKTAPQKPTRKIHLPTGPTASASRSAICTASAAPLPATSICEPITTTQRPKTAVTPLPTPRSMRQTLSMRGPCRFCSWIQYPYDNSVTVPPTPPRTARIHDPPPGGTDGTRPAAISPSGGAISAVVPTTVTNIRPMSAAMIDSKALKFPFSTKAMPARECATAQIATDCSAPPRGSKAAPATPHAVTKARPTMIENRVR